jgi:hypothetical protein
MDRHVFAKRPKGESLGYVETSGIAQVYRTLEQYLKLPIQNELGPFVALSRLLKLQGSK